MTANKKEKRPSHSIIRKLSILWTRISNFGADRQSSVRIKKRVVLSNRLLLIMLGIQVLSVFIFMNTPYAVSNAITSIIIVIFISCILMLNKYGHSVISRSLLCIVFPLIVTASGLISLTTVDIVLIENIIASRIVITATIVLLFALLDSKHEKIPFFISLFINLVILFLYDYICQYLGIMYKVAGGYQYDPFIISTVHIIIVLFIILVIFHIEGITNNYERKNVALIQDLQTKNFTIHEQSKEIQTQMEEIQAQTEELQSQNEQLGNRENQLIEKQHLINNQNKDLNELNKSLEKIVEQRTSELRDSNSQLTRKIEDLSQFSYTLSHNLRAPAASIKGLLNLMDKDTKLDSDHEISDMLRLSTDSLLKVMTELQTILDIKSQADLTYEQVNINSVVDEVLNKNQAFLTSINAKISTNFKVEHVSSVNSYLHKIISVLIENAIKFRQDELDLAINISTSQENGRLIISVTDNGIGFDKDRHAYELFKLYKRFHTHLEGSGVGLYLAKAYVDALGGSIDVDTEVLKGSKFTVSLPLEAD